MIPETRAVFLSAFYDLVHADFADLVEVDADPTDALTSYDRDDVRCLLNDAVCETAALLNLPCRNVHDEGELTDLVLEVWTGLNDYLIATTE